MSFNGFRLGLAAGVWCAVANWLGGVGAVASVVSDNPGGWDLTFSDEFVGSALDGAKWANRLPGVRNSATNTADAVSVGDGVLTIKTYTEGGTNYTGMVGTQGKFEQAYGYFEARVKFHDSPGEWSAFWLTSATYGNPIGDPGTAGTEIDVAEHRATAANGSDIRANYLSAVHWDGYGTDHKQAALPQGPLAGLGNDSWHTYGLKWSPTGYQFYFDDALMGTVSQAVSGAKEYVILSSEVRDANWAGDVPAGGYGSAGASVTNVQVDYVRVYQVVPEPMSMGLVWAGCVMLLRRRR